MPYHIIFCYYTWKKKEEEQVVYFAINQIVQKDVETDVVIKKRKERKI